MKTNKIFSKRFLKALLKGRTLEHFKSLSFLQALTVPALYI